MFKEQFGAQMRSASGLPGLPSTMQYRGFTGEILLRHDIEQLFQCINLSLGRSILWDDASYGYD